MLPTGGLSPLLALSWRCHCSYLYHVSSQNLRERVFCLELTIIGNADRPDCFIESQRIPKYGFQSMILNMELFVT